MKIIKNIPLKNHYQSNPLIFDYLCNKLKDIAYTYPSLDSILRATKKKSFAKKKRNILYSSIKKDYENLTASKQTLARIEFLKAENCFTITTGHQLNLFTGPLYFFYKIIHTINLCEKLNDIQKEFKYVPIYWMAGEDHDFEEINHFFHNSEKITWNKKTKGAVGDLNTSELKSVYEKLESYFGTNNFSKELIQLFKDCYLHHDTLANAHKYLINELFKDDGLIILDANKKELKSSFNPILEQEILERKAFNTMQPTLEYFKKMRYKIQVTPREINIFYLKKNSRERIVYENNLFKINNTSLSFTKKELLKELEEFPERFSPNVILRPIYQEFILPNIAYIGGAGEISYWLELKEVFKEFNVTYPNLIIRNSVALISKKNHEKLQKLHLTVTDLLTDKHTAELKIIKQNSKLPLDLKGFLNDFNIPFQELYKLAKETDKSLENSIRAYEQKHHNYLNNLEKKMIRAEKKQYHSKLTQFRSIREELFPNSTLQERKINFSVYYKEYGSKFVSDLKKIINPFQTDFIVVELED